MQPSHNGLDQAHQLTTLMPQPGSSFPDSRWMHLALDQAKRGIGLTSPNPPVGAIIVQNDKVIGQGHHQKAGGPHAEIEAIQDAQRHFAKLLPGSTLYVTLEPCSSSGRTGPCTEAIKTSGIRRVVWGANDPNPHHQGRAREILNIAGISVTSGVLQQECADIIRPFSKWIRTGMPYVIAKAGQSLDGRISRPPGEGVSITSEAARAHARRLRPRVDAILVGAGTARADDPRLTIREGLNTQKRQPLRVILSRSGNLSAELRVLSDEHKDRTVVLHGPTLEEALRELGRREVLTVLIEGGSEIFGQAFAEKLVDEVVWYIAPMICGSACLPSVGGNPLPHSVALENIKVLSVGETLCITGNPLWNPTPTPQGQG